MASTGSTEMPTRTRPHGGRRKTRADGREESADEPDRAIGTVD